MNEWSGLSLLSKPQSDLGDSEKAGGRTTDGRTDGRTERKRVRCLLPQRTNDTQTDRQTDRLNQKLAHSQTDRRNVRQANLASRVVSLER